jgi:adenylate kinase
VLLNVSDDAVIERVLARRLCSGCGLDYNLIHHRPSNPDECDVCGAPLIARSDDVEEAIRKRMDDFHEQTEPVVDLFRTKELVVEVDGMAPIDRVNDQIRCSLGLPLPARFRKQA